MAHNIAEKPALGAEHAQSPSPFRREVYQIGQGWLGWRRETVFQIFVPLTEDLKIERNDQRGTVGGLGSINQAAQVILVFHRVELKPKRGARVFGHILDGANRHR